MNPFTALKNLSPFHFTSLFIYLLFFTYSMNPSLRFTLLFISTTHFISLHFPSLFTFYRLHFPSLVFTFLTLVLKICVLPWEVPLAPPVACSGQNGPVHQGVFSEVCSLFSGSDFPIMMDSTSVALRLSPNPLFLYIREFSLYATDYSHAVCFFCFVAAHKLHPIEGEISRPV